MQLQFPNGHIFNMTAKISNHELDGVCIYQLFMLEMSREYFALHQIGNWNTTTLYPKPKRNWYILFNPLKDELQKCTCETWCLSDFLVLPLHWHKYSFFVQSIEKGRKATYTWMKQHLQRWNTNLSSGIPGPYLDYFFSSPVIGPATGRWRHGEK